MADTAPGRARLTPRVSTLLRAVQRGDYGVLTNLLKSSNGEDHEGNADLGLLAALLVEACSREHLDCIELLLQKMMKPSPKRNLKRRGYFPMHTAAGAGATESIELLLSAGLSPKTRDRSGRTPLHVAAAQGSAECVSLLCAVARSTVVSRDRETGDTPVHFAARARNGVCIEVLLSYAQGGYDILRETNAKGETPLDIAEALGDTRLVLRTRSAARGGGRTCPEGGVDMQLIMAVWERFFENAVVACVGGRNTTLAPGVPSSDQHGQLGAGRYGTTAKTLELGGWVTPGDQPAMDHTTAKEANAVTIARGNGLRTGAERTIRSGDEGEGWSESEADTFSLGAAERDDQLSHPLPGKPAVENARTCAWDAVPIDPVSYYHEVETLYGNSRQRAIPQQPIAREDQHVQLESEAPVLSSDDVDLHLFRTPRGESSVAEVEWLSASHQGKIRSTLEPPPDNVSSPDAATAAGSLAQNPHTWVACWDAASESIYFWNSESGESTWDAPASTDGVRGLQSCVWDPRWETFFTIDDGGTSHWLENSTVEGRQTMDDAISLGTSVPSVQVVNDGRTNSGSTSSTTRPSWQGFGPTVGAMEGSPSTEAVGFPDNVQATLAQEAEEERAAGKTMQGETDRQEQEQKQSLRLSPHSLAEVGYPVGQLSNCLINGHYYPGEQRFSGMTNLTAQEQEHAGQDQHEVELTARGEQQLLANTAPASATNSENAGEDNSSDGGEYFDSRTYEDLEGHLSAWFMWCTVPSYQDGDEPPYFVDEETLTSSWVLPPEAVATSGGWLRAWSEEHQAWFYANQWTGKVTWELSSC